MFYAIDIGIDYYGPKIVPPNRIYRVQEAKDTPRESSKILSLILSLNFPNDKDISRATLKDEHGGTRPARVTVFSSDITVYKDADENYLDGGGTGFVIQDAKSTHVSGIPSKPIIVALARFLIHSLACQGIFSINIFLHEELPIDVPLQKAGLTTEQMDNLQCANNVFIGGNMTSRSLELKLYDEPAVFWKWVWGVNDPQL